MFAKETGIAKEIINQVVYRHDAKQVQQKGLDKL